jgi:hypothetical protein
VFHQSVWGGPLAGKSTADVEALLDKGIYSMEKLKEGGWITDIKYADEVSHLMKPFTLVLFFFAWVCFLSLSPLGELAFFMQKIFGWKPD